ncbi:MAG: hypothetical protein ABI315_10005 [Bacteroidia bacterium]
MNYKISYVICLLLLATFKIHSQNRVAPIMKDSIIDYIDSVKDVTSCIEFNNRFDNKLVFWGRDFGDKQYGVESNIIYKQGKGLYLYLTNNYWSAMVNKFAKIDLGIGYEHQFNDRIYASARYERWFFQNGRRYGRRALKNCINANLDIDLDYINVETSLYSMWGIEHVYQIDLNLYQEIQLFPIFKSGFVTTTPQFLTSFANQALLPIYSDVSFNYINERKFTLVDMELSLPIQLKIRNLKIGPDFHYNIPIKIENEEINPFFYFSIHLNYNFYFDHGKLKRIYRQLAS